MHKKHMASTQAGFSLVIVLVFMLVLIMIGITGMQASGLQERMAGHSRDRSVALQAGEATLRFAEDKALSVAPLDFDASCTNGLCAAGSAPDPFSYGWNDGKSIAVDASEPRHQLSPDLAANPRYFMEQGGTMKRPGEGSGGVVPVLRPTVRSVGENANTAIRLQSAIFQP